MHLRICEPAPFESDAEHVSFARFVFSCFCYLLTCMAGIAYSPAGMEERESDALPLDNSSIFYNSEDVSVDEQAFVEKLEASDTKEALILLFSNIAAHPRLPRASLLQCARKKKNEVKEAGLWCEEVAKQFGQALKAANMNEKMARKYVEAFHPVWSRWRCALVTSGTPCVDEAIEVQFFDDEKKFQVVSEKTKLLPFISIPMLRAAEERNIPRLVALLKTDRRSVHIIRTGCSLLISLTVGSTHRTQELYGTDCVEVCCSMLEERLENLEDGDTVESLLRVLLNLACDEEIIPRIDSSDGIEKIILCLDRFPQHGGVQYAGAKTLHNIALDNPALAKKAKDLRAIELISLAQSTFPNYAALLDWGEKSKEVIHEASAAGHGMNTWNHMTDDDDSESED